MGAPIVVMTIRIRAPRLSTIPAFQKAIAALIAVSPLSSSAHGWISLIRSYPKRPRTGIAMNATPRPSIPDRKLRPNRRGVRTSNISRVNVSSASVMSKGPSVTKAGPAGSGPPAPAGHETTPDEASRVGNGQVMARPAGFEPTTPSSASWCSIH